MSRMKLLQEAGGCWMVIPVVAALVLCLVPASAGAQPPEANVVLDGMVNAQIVEQADYEFLAVAYDETDNILYFAAMDGEHFDPPMAVVNKAPIAEISSVNVISNSDVAIIDGKKTELETGFDDSATADFERLSRGCTVKLVAKDPNFGSAELGEGVVSDGKFTVAYEELEIDKTKEVDIGFFMCDHARNLQREFDKLRREVKKGE